MVGRAGPAPHPLQRVGYAGRALAAQALLGPVFDLAILGEDPGDGRQIHQIEGPAIFDQQIGNLLAVRQAVLIGAMKPS